MGWGPNHVVAPFLFTMTVRWSQEYKRIYFGFEIGVVGVGDHMYFRDFAE
jgi:hypothetical protein